LTGRDVTGQRIFPAICWTEMGVWPSTRLVQGLSVL
jgi:hypothetical protein